MLRKCLYCGKEFKVPSKKPRQKYCCKDCADKSYIKDLTGKKFGKLTVLEFVFSDRHTSYWLCQCDCGNKCIKSRKNLISNNAKSCGCLMLDARCFKYPYYRELSHILTGMKSRCYNPKIKSYKHYGGRGIKICNEWMKDNLVFYNWAIDNGYKKGLTIERIDVNDNYCPENCIWIPKELQSKNKRDNVKITYQDKTLNLIDWARLLNIPYKTLYARIRCYKWDIEKAFTTPLRVRN